MAQPVAEFVFAAKKPMDAVQFQHWGRGLPQRIALFAGAPLVFGRSDDAGVQLDSTVKDCVVSRVHTKVVVRRDKRTQRAIVAISDANSTNGVSINGVRVREAELRHGDLVTLGGAGRTPFGSETPDLNYKTDVTYRVELRKTAAESDSDATQEDSAPVTNKSKRKRSVSPAKKSKSKKKTLATPRFKAGNKVEAQSLNEQTREVDAWFDAKIVKVLPQQEAYVIRYDGYGAEFDEKLAFSRVRRRATGEWSAEQLQENKTRLLCQYRARQLWYDCLLIEKLADPEIVGMHENCVEVRWIENPNLSPSELKKPFKTSKQYVFLPEQEW